MLTENLILQKTKQSDLRHVRKLNACGIELTDIDIIRNLSNLEVCSLSVNNISSLEPLSGCTRLQELYLRRNNIEELDEVYHLSQLRHLRQLWLSQNPCTQYRNYRAFVAQALPQLVKLDDEIITDAERKGAVASGQDHAASAHHDSLVHHSFPSSSSNGSAGGATRATTAACIPQQQPRQRISPERRPRSNHTVVDEVAANVSTRKTISSHHSNATASSAAHQRNHALKRSSTDRHGNTSHTSHPIPGRFSHSTNSPQPVPPGSSRSPCRQTNAHIAPLNRNLSHVHTKPNVHHPIDPMSTNAEHTPKKERPKDENVFRAVVLLLNELSHRGLLQVRHSVMERLDDLHE